MPGPIQVFGGLIMTRGSIEEIKARVHQFADAFENHQAKPGNQATPLSPVIAVKLTAWRHDAAEGELAGTVRAARHQRLPWHEVGEAIGTSGEAARQRYLTCA